MMSDWEPMYPAYRPGPRPRRQRPYKPPAVTIPPLMRPETQESEIRIKLPEVAVEQPVIYGLVFVVLAVVIGVILGFSGAVCV